MKKFSFRQLCQTAALAFLVPVSAQASQTFNFSLSDVDGYYDGGTIISGIITLNGDGDGIFSASSIELTSLPGYANFTDVITVNTFTVSGGNISYASFYGRDFGQTQYLALNYGYFDALFSGPFAIVDFVGEANSLQFSPTAAPVPEPSTLALFAAGAGVMGAARRRRAAGKKAA